MVAMIDVCGLIYQALKRCSDEPGPTHLTLVLVLLCGLRSSLSAQGRVPLELVANAVGGEHFGGDEERKRGPSVGAI